MQKLVNYNFNMADIENTFTASNLKNISQCDISLGKNNQLAKPKLDRWKDLNNAIIDWINNDALDETSIKIAEQNNFQFYDKIQKAIMVDLFARFRSIYPKQGAEFNHDFPIKEVSREINGEEYAITTYFTYEFIENGSSEYIKLKTAFDPEPDLIDKAIITKLKKENEDFYVASTEREDLEEIELVENPDEVIDYHFEILENFLNKKEQKKLKRNPGDFCSMGCDMASRCGQFPLVNIDKLTNRIREVKITKTNAIKLNQCERRASWNAQYGIPKENYNDYDTESLGTKFHNYSQMMLVSNKNFLDQKNIAKFETFTEHEDQITRDKLFNKYKELVQKLKPYKNLSITKSEFNVGFTIASDGKGIQNGKIVDKKVATIFMGRTDLIGRIDRKPIIIELKTRPEFPEDFLEAQLYALGVAKLDKTTEVTVLHVYLTDDETTIKERNFSESELEEAEKKYQSLAKKSASWIPFNALSVKFNLGDWCQGCEYKNLCSENRNTAEQIEVISLEKELEQKKEDIDEELRRLYKDEKHINDLKIEYQSQLQDMQKQQELEKSELKKLKIELKEADEKFKKITDEKNIAEAKKQYEAKKEFYIKESEKMETEFIALEREVKIVQENKNKIEELSLASSGNLHPNLIFMSLKDSILLKTMRTILKQSGFDSDFKLLNLDEELYTKTWEWKKIRGARPTKPYSDIRYMIKLLEFSKSSLSYAPTFQYLKQDQRDSLTKLRKKLNSFAHISKPLFSKEDILEIGDEILSLHKSFLATNYFIGDSKEALLTYQNEAKQLLNLVKD